MALVEPVQGGASESSLLERARRLHPLLSGEAAKGDAKGTLTETTLAALTDAGST